MTRALIADLRAKAQKLSLEPFNGKDYTPEDAVRKFRAVMALTLPDDELHQRAKSWLEKLEP